MIEEKRDVEARKLHTHVIPKVLSKKVRWLTKHYYPVLPIDLQLTVNQYEGSFILFLCCD